ncbi:MAG: universal stress protein, partial [Chloroflexota bacterium]
LATEATLVLVLAMPPLSIPSMSLYMEATGYQIYADAWEADYQRLTRYVDEKANALRACGLQVETQLAQGNPAEVILKAVDDSDPDLIVMSTHSGGSSNSGALREIQELLLGSVALKMVQEAWLPVLLIPVRETSSAQVSVGEFAEASLDELQDVHSELAPVANVEPMTAVEPERRRPTAKDLSRP